MSLLFSNYNLNQMNEIIESSEFEEQDVLYLYKNEIENRKKELNNTDDDLSMSELNFLENVIHIKNKIKHMKIIYQDLKENANIMSKEIDSIQKMKLDYESFSATYQICMNPNHLNKDILLQITTALNEKKNELNKINSNMDDLLRKITTYQQIISNQDKNESLQLCPTCQTESITHCLNPCGHCYCKDCISRINVPLLTSRCYICRKTAISSIKLYML
jgi:hypothetical protein